MTAIAGAGRLAAFSLRVDRRRITAWAVASGIVVVVVGIAFNRLYPTSGSRESLVALADSPVLRAILGPLLAPATTGGLVAWRMGSILTVILALATTFLVVARTRGEEQRGRGALLASLPVGRGSPVVAALLDAAVLDAAAGLSIVAALLCLAQSPTDSLALGLGVGASAWSFGAAAALVAQLTATSRAANGIAAGIVGASFLVRALGELYASWVTWLSPIGWVGTLRAFADPRYWLLVVPLGIGAAVGACAVCVALGREQGRGLRAERAAPSTPLSPSALGLAWRLEHVAIAVTAVAGLAYAVLAGSIVGLFDRFVKSSPVLERAIVHLGGTHVLKDAFTTTMAIYGGIAMGAFAVSLVLRLHSEESHGRVTVLCAAGATRSSVIEGFSATALCAGVVGTLAWGLGLGIGRLLVDHSTLGLARGVEAGIVCVPAVVALVAVAVAAVGATRRAGAIAWGVVVWCAVASVLGPFLGLPSWVSDLSPFTHVAPLPLSGSWWVRCTVLLGVAAIVGALGRSAYLRRELGGA